MNDQAGKPPPKRNVPPARSSEEDDDDVFAVRARVTREQALELGTRDLDFGDRPHVRPNPDGTAVIELFLSRSQIEELGAAGYTLEIGDNVSAAGRERQADVGRGDRFEGGRNPPRGLGRKLGSQESSGRRGQGGAS